MKIALFSAAAGPADNAGDAIIEAGLLSLLAVKPCLRLPLHAPLSDDDVDAVNACDVAVIAGTNLYQRHFACNLNLETLHRLRVPVIPCGVGASAPLGGLPDMDAEGVAAVRAIHTSCACGSVRDPATLQFLRSIGVENVMLTGCPALFHGLSLPEFSRASEEGQTAIAPRARLLHLDAAARKYYQAKMLRSMEVVAERRNCVLVMQSPYDLPFCGDLARRNNVSLCYDPTWQVEPYLTVLHEISGCVSFRLHFAMLCLAHGKIAHFLGHDSRTASFCDLLALPMLDIRSYTDRDLLARLDNKAFPAEAFRRRWAQLSLDMAAFLRANDLPTRLIPEAAGRVHAASAQVQAAPVAAQAVARVQPRFRNDDVAADTDVENFSAFCRIFHKHGFRQVHGVVLRGRCSVRYLHVGRPVEYEGHDSISRLDNAAIRALSEGHELKDNAPLVELLRSLPDELALHGLYHTDYAAMSPEEQYEEMRQGLECLHVLFPEKRIRYFIPPFNRFNAETCAVAEKLGLRLLRPEGVHLEAMLDTLMLEPGVWYRYHHHRFYPDSAFTHYSLSLEALDAALQGPRDGLLPMPSTDLDLDLRKLADAISRHQAQRWYLTSARNRSRRAELVLALRWIFCHIGRECRIFEAGCGSGNNLLWLAQHGYDHLGGSDNDASALAVAREMAELTEAPIEFFQTDILKQPLVWPAADVLLAMNCLYLIPGFSLRAFLQRALPGLSPGGCLVFDLIDACYNEMPDNECHTQDAHLPREQRRPSEYKARYGQAQVEAVCADLGLKAVLSIRMPGKIPRVVYVLARLGTVFKPRLPLALEGRRLSAAEAKAVVAQIEASGLFDRDWYRKEYVRGPEIMDPLEHYVRFGADKGYRPNADFDTLAYRQKHMGFSETFQNPFLHYIRACANQKKLKA